MASDLHLSENERSFASTTWVQKGTKIRRPAGGQDSKSAVGRPLRLLPHWPWRKPLTIKVRYRGGSEGWFEIHARGAVVRRIGHISLYELMFELTRQDLPGPKKPGT